jgi:ADP-heptose:LPS heptosyltransferase
MKILTIPGIGDIHWVMLKLESWIAKNCPGEIPEVHVWNFDGRPRSEDFVRRIPFVKFAGYFNTKIEDLDSFQKKIFQRSYMTGRNGSEEKGYLGFDTYLCVNGQLRVGHDMKNILPNYETNWDYKLDLTGTEPKIKEPYIIFYFSDHGMFKQWVTNLTPEKIKEFLSLIKGYRLILTGSTWDGPFNKHLEDAGVENWCGDTSLDELLSLIRGASAFVGWCGGNTIISQHLNTPTLMLWSDYFPSKAFQTNWVKPEKIGTVYKNLNVENLTVNTLTQTLGDLLDKGK